MTAPDINTLGQLKASGYQHRTIKEEINDNLIKRLREGASIFDGIHGYEQTVRPQFERAILAGHNILLLGRRGQAKTRLARKMVELLDEYVPVIRDSELVEDPLAPITSRMMALVRELGDDTPVEWVHRDERLVEKLATPDVSVADLIGDLDPIKAASQKLSYADERAIHYGLVPRAHRCIFVLNELPDLQPRIQVALFNILQERDIQIRGFNLRIPLDIQFVFTANPEDYTNRGSIITPLKDRIESQIKTHYPLRLDDDVAIMKQEMRIDPHVMSSVCMPDLAYRAIASIADQARGSDFVDQDSGVSARMSITAIEQLYAACHRRMLLMGADHTEVRVSDFIKVLPAMTGKLELDYEGEQMGSTQVGMDLIQEGLISIGNELLPIVDEEDDDDPYEIIKLFFDGDRVVDLREDMSDEEYKETLLAIPGVKQVAADQLQGLDIHDSLFGLELVLHHLVGQNELILGYAQDGTKYLGPFGF